MQNFAEKLAHFIYRLHTICRSYRHVKINIPKCLCISPRNLQIMLRSEKHYRIILQRMRLSIDTDRVPIGSIFHRTV